MAEVTLKKRDTEVLKINIGDKAYSLPLGGSIPYKQLKKLKQKMVSSSFCRLTCRQKSWTFCPPKTSRLSSQLGARLLRSSQVSNWGNHKPQGVH